MAKAGTPSPGSTRLSRQLGQQRGQAVRVAFVWAALRAVTRPTQPHRFRVIHVPGYQSVAKAEYRSGQTPQSCRVTVTTRAVMPAVQPFFLGWRCALRVCTTGITAFPCSNAGAVSQCARLGFATRRQSDCWLAPPEGGESWWCTPAAATRFAALRVYIRPHFGKCLAVAALKLRLVPATAARPHGFPKQALCKVAYARQRARQPSALPGRWCALRAAACAPWRLFGVGVFGQALRAVF